MGREFADVRRCSRKHLAMGMPASANLSLPWRAWSISSGVGPCCRQREVRPYVFIPPEQPSEVGSVVGNLVPLACDCVNAWHSDVGNVGHAARSMTPQVRATWSGRCAKRLRRACPSRLARRGEGPSLNWTRFNARRRINFALPPELRRQDQVRVASMEGRMSYHLEGRLLEVCNCNVLCPCWIGEDPDNGTCDTIVAYHFDKGTVEGVDVSGTSVAIVAHVPGNILQGNWRVAIHVDAKATKEQEEALLKVYTGKLGG